MKAKRILSVKLGATLLLAAAAAVILAPNATTQGRGAATPEQIAARKATEAELESVAIIDRKVMVPMRDGKRMATDIYRPKDTSKKYPAPPTISIIGTSAPAPRAPWPPNLRPSSAVMPTSR
jgi:predicted acyl esterase